MTVSFTDKEKGVLLQEGFEADESELGYVFYPKEGIILGENISVNYVEYPWITCFEVEGIELLPPPSAASWTPSEDVNDVSEAFPFENS